MKRLGWELKLGIFLILASVLLYLLHYAIFRDAHHIFVYGVAEIAFLPLEVLLVTLIIHRLLDEQKKHETMEKLNMVIGVFFSEVGTRLLGFFSDYDPELNKKKEYLRVNNNWSDKEFQSIKATLKCHEYKIDIDKVDVLELQTFLVSKRSFFLTLLENPTLLEHETFTDLLMAVFHLTEELEFRNDILHIPESDRVHIANDIARAYGILSCQWLDYLKHLKNNYPYLFSLAIRINPFDENASAIVRK